MRDQHIFLGIHNRKFIELCLSLFVGLFFGLLVAITPSLSLTSEFKSLIYLMPFALTTIILFNNLNKLILALIAISIPLNLDFSIVISPYARNIYNIAQGNRTITALTELRISFLLIIVVVGYVLWFLVYLKNDRRKIKLFTDMIIPFWGLILFSFFSMFYAQDVQLSFFKVAQLIELFLVFFYLSNHIGSKQEMRFFVTVLIIGILAESALMTIQWLTGWGFSIAGIEVSRNAGRPGGTLGSANTAGVIISAFLIIILTMFWLSDRYSQKVLAGTSYIVGCVALISTAGRAAWGGFVVAILAFIFMGWRRGWVKRKAFVWVFLIILVICVVFFPIISNRLTADDGGSAESRPKMFRLAWSVISSSPSHFLFGVGANNYALVAPAYNNSENGYLSYFIQDTSVHNVFLLTWAETGLIGLICFLILIFASIIKVRTHILSNDRFISLMAIGLSCAFLVIIIQMLVDPFMARPKIIFFWLIISLIASLDNIQTKGILYVDNPV